MRKTREGWGETGRRRDRLSPIFPAATAPFPKSCESYFRFARFNTFPLYYLRAWHRLVKGPSGLTDEFYGQDVLFL